MRYDLDDLLKNYSMSSLKAKLYTLGGIPSTKNKKQIAECIIQILSGAEIPEKSRRGRPVLSKYDRDIEGERIVTVSDNETEFKNGNTVSGIFDPCTEGYGFIRAENYAFSKQDAFIARPTVKAAKIRKGDFVVGRVEKRRENERAEMVEIISVNGHKDNFERVNFDDLVPIYPNEKINLEFADCDLSVRCIDLFSPIGKGQRGLIVAQPKSGKTTLLKNIALAVEKNHPEIHLIVLLVDERPEEVTDFKKSISGEVISSTFDESPEHHLKVTELALSRAKRLVEEGKDVFILIDSITKLTRACNTTTVPSGKTLSGGIDPLALGVPKRFFGAARNTDNGSLTIVATALVETGSRMDDVIFEEFKGTGNMEIVLSRSLAEKRIFPAIDLYKSGTRKEELLLSDKEINAAISLRRIMQSDSNSIESLFDMMRKTSSNSEMFTKLSSWISIYNKK